MPHGHDLVMALAAAVLVVAGAGFVMASVVARLGSASLGSTQARIAAPAIDGRKAIELTMVAGLFGAAAIHAAAVSAHKADPVFAAAFAVAAGVQVLTGIWVASRSPLGHTLAIRSSVVFAVIWLLSRSVGLPIGPHPWVGEDIGIADATATAFEIGVVVLALLVRPEGSGQVTRARRENSDLVGIGLVPTIGVVGLVALIAMSSLLSPSGSHHHAAGATPLAPARSLPGE